MSDPTIAAWSREGDLLFQLRQLREAVNNPVLQDSEQYRMQMAAICTAAIGYWTEYDSISTDYDTVALRDVAKLYAKYDALYKAQQGAVAHDVIAGVLFDFMAWLTSRPKRIMLSSADDASPAVDAIRDFAKMRGLSLDDAKVQDWQEALAQPQQFVECMCGICKLGLQRKPLSDEEIEDIWKQVISQDNGRNAHLSNQPFVHIARAIEAAHGIKE